MGPLAISVGKYKVSNYATIFLYFFRGDCYNEDFFYLKCERSG
jgi:hypothetical protein